MPGRPAAAAAGFDAVEFWWPFDVAVPSESDVDAFVRSVRDEGVRLVGLNFFAGDMPGGERGVVSSPARTAEFRDNIEVAVEIADRPGCRAFNALYGNRVDGVTRESRTSWRARTSRWRPRPPPDRRHDPARTPQSARPKYPLKTAAEALAVTQRVRTDAGVDNVALLADLYHLAVNGDDLDVVVSQHVPQIGHVQIADAPGPQRARHRRARHRRLPRQTRRQRLRRVTSARNTSPVAPAPTALTGLPTT